MLEKYVGRIVDIIYMATDGKLTQRRIRVRSVNDGVVRAFCMASCAPRTFKIENILAVQPVVRTA